MNTSVLTLYVFVIMMVQLPGSFVRNPFGFGPKLPDWMPYQFDGQESDYSEDSDDNSIIVARSSQKCEGTPAMQRYKCSNLIADEDTSLTIHEIKCCMVGQLNCK